MAKEAAIIFPNQLFRENPVILKQRIIFLVESSRYFSDFAFHKKKLMLHRASMQAYKDRLEADGYDVIYIEWVKEDDFLLKLKEYGVKTLHYIDPVDFKQEKELLDLVEKVKGTAVKTDNPGFLTTNKQLEKFFSESGKFLFNSFYIDQRKRLKILVTSSKKPVGGKWSYDPENRRKVPPYQKIPKIKTFKSNKYIKEAGEYIKENFPDNPGTTDDFTYPILYNEVLEWFRDFLEHRFKLFGDYEDAIEEKESYLFHSVISYALNSGLITPQQVVQEALDYGQKNNIPMNSIEGFIRQVIGWREYVRAVYILKEDYERNTNYFNFTKQMPASFYSATTGIDPVDITIKKLLETSYSHHIERLMVLGNFMLLCEISPHEVYKWFMELYIDAYDWVMVPNVYGMSQYADGGLIMTKPYISSSNYIKKMSDFKSGDWCEIWDALYWRFIDKYKEIFRANNRTALMVMTLERKPPEETNRHIDTAEKFLKNLS